jgi:hypothetical protein
VGERRLSQPSAELDGQAVERGTFQFDAFLEFKHRRYELEQLTTAKRQAAKLHDELGVWVTRWSVSISGVANVLGTDTQACGSWPVTFSRSGFLRSAIRQTSLTRLAAFANRL